MSSEVDCTFRGNIIAGEIPLGLGEFEPFFKQATKSRYAEKYSFNTHLTQDDVLGWRLAMDCPDLYNEVKTKLADNPGRTVIFAQNPCHFGFTFGGISLGNTVICVFFLFVCSPGFQSPEQLKAESLSTSCDVYAFGGVLVVLFGEMPLWPCRTPFQILYRVTVLSEYPRVEHLSPTIQGICRICFRTVPERPTMAEVLAAFRTNLS